MHDSQAAIRLILAQRNRTPWFYKPQWYWHGWKTLLPFTVSHDEYARRTIMLGWTITGRVIFPLWDCGDIECQADAMAAIKQGGDDE